MKNCLHPITRIFAILLLCFFPAVLMAQSVGINADGSTPDPSSILDIKSTNKGMLLPRMTTAERNAITAPAAGLMVFDTNTNSLWYFGGSWRNMVSNWSITGNAGTNHTNHFIGTADNAPLRFRVNNEISGLISLAPDYNTSFGYQSMQ